MIKNYLKVSFRNLLNQKGFSFINIVGLTMGLTVSGLIFIYVIHEISYDRFHEHVKDIYRVAVKTEMPGQKFNVALSSAPMGPALVNEYPEFSSFTRVYKTEQVTLISHLSDKFYDKDIIYADSSFFTIFSFKFIRGEPLTVLINPNSIVLTDQISKKLFG